jgi:hypothetical protein
MTARAIDSVQPPKLFLAAIPYHGSVRAGTISHNTPRQGAALRRLLGRLDRPDAGFHDGVNFISTAF